MTDNATNILNCIVYCKESIAELEHIGKTKRLHEGQWTTICVQGCEALVLALNLDTNSARDLKNDLEIFFNIMVKYNINLSQEVKTKVAYSLLCTTPREKTLQANGTLPLNCVGLNEAKSFIKAVKRLCVKVGAFTEQDYKAFISNKVETGYIKYLKI